MRTFAPSAIALAAGLAWVLVSTALIPATEEDGDASAASVVAMRGVCNSSSLIARLPDVHEASGLALSRRHPGTLWTHNDSGPPIVYAVSVDGQLRARIAVTGAMVDDWEGIATGPCGTDSCLYIGDIGDNKEARTQITVYRVPEPTLTDRATARVEAFAGMYPDGPQDAEALFVGADGTMFIVTKGEGSAIGVYRFPAGTAPGATTRLERVVTLARNKVEKDERITDAALTPDAKWVALRTLDRVEFHRTDALLAGTPNDPIQVDVSWSARAPGRRPGG